MSTTATVHHLPSCDVCRETARYDAKTVGGPWAYLCPRHWRSLTNMTLGTGFGQRLMTEAEKAGAS